MRSKCLELTSDCSHPLEPLKAMAKPHYKNKPILPLIDPANQRALEDVFEKVDEDKQMADEQQQKQVSTETKAERKLRLKKVQLKKHLDDLKLGI